MDPPSQSASEHAYEAMLSLHLCKSFSVSLFLSPFVPDLPNQEFLIKILSLGVSYDCHSLFHLCLERTYCCFVYFNLERQCYGVIGLHRQYGQLPYLWDLL